MITRIPSVLSVCLAHIRRRIVNPSVERDGPLNGDIPRDAHVISMIRFSSFSDWKSSGPAAGLLLAEPRLSHTSVRDASSSVRTIGARSGNVSRGGSRRAATMVALPSGPKMAGAGAVCGGVVLAGGGAGGVPVGGVAGGGGAGVVAPAVGDWRWIELASSRVLFAPKTTAVDVWLLDEGGE